MHQYQTSRSIAPFFEDAINQVFIQPNKQMFIMDGPIGLGKSSNFLIYGAYSISKCVAPTLQNGQLVRESLWAAIRESENSTIATLSQIFQDAIFTPEIFADPNGPVRIHGSHPAFITIEHGMPDDTILRMHIECHGFNNVQAEGRLRSREYLGVIIPEIQTIPWEIAEVARQRAGRWRTKDTKIEKIIDGQKYRLSGVQQLKMVLADANIPARPHLMYDRLYDQPSLDGTPYVLLTPPSPILPIPVKSVDDIGSLEAYPKTRFENEDVVWVPNPECYFMTKHFETDEVDPTTGDPVRDEHGEIVTVPWSGYTYWFNELNQSDSILRRHILGKPTTVGGDNAVYRGFDKSTHVKVRDIVRGGTVYVGYDPGKYAAFVFMQVVNDHDIHIFHELIFTPSDEPISRNQIQDFVIPYVSRVLAGFNVEFVVDPSGAFGTSAGEGAISVLRELGLKFRPCVVANQDTDSRRDCLGFFLDSGRLTIDPSCVSAIKAMVGGYQYKTLRSGVVSDAVDKNESSHTAEAIQYPVVNIYRVLVKGKGTRDGRSSSRISKLRNIRR